MPNEIHHPLFNEPGMSMITKSIIFFRLLRQAEASLFFFVFFLFTLEVLSYESYPLIKTREN